MEPIKIDLTIIQMAKLEPIFKKLREIGEEKPGMVLAQVYDSCFVCGLLTHEKGLKIQECLGQQAGKITESFEDRRNMESLIE